MTIRTYLRIRSHDAQGRKSELIFRINPVGFGTGVDLPSEAKIKDVVNALYGSSAKPSNSIVDGWDVIVEQNDPTGAAGGTGGSASSTVARTRSGDSEYIERVPGLNQAAVSFDSSNRNSIVTSTAMWNTAKAALADAEIAIADPEATSYTATAETDIFRSATLFDGKRSPIRPT